MAKKTRKNKDLARLRREVEILKAQLAGQQNTGAMRIARTTRKTKEVEPEANEKSLQARQIIQTVDPKYIKADLLRSTILTLIAFGITAALTFLL